MKWLLAFLLSCSIGKAATITAANPGPVAVSNAIQLVAAGDTLAIPAGTSNWTYGVSWTAPSNVVVLGAGTSATGGGDQTVIVDNYAANEPLINITIPGAGVFRFSGITVRGGTGTVKDEEGMVRFLGANSVSQLRVDHCNFDAQTYSAPGGSHDFVVANIKGVVDHCIFHFYGNSSTYCYRAGNSGFGDEVWASETGFGSDDFIFYEDCIIYGGAAAIDASSFPSRMWDNNSGGKSILRFCDLYFSSGGENHATGHAGNDRGGRATETYGNHYMQRTNQAAAGRTPRAMVDGQGGTTLLWGNTADTDALQSYAVFTHVRRNMATYAQTPNPTGWGYTGPAPITNGTVNVNGTAVTKATGPNFDVTWPEGTAIYIVGMTCTGIAGQEPAAGPSGIILTVGSTTSITLSNGGHTGAPLTGAAYTVGSIIDGNTDSYGYPGLDQTGRGRGALLTNAWPDKINASSGILSWPTQALEPAYIFANSGTPNVIHYSSSAPTLIHSNRDFYAQMAGGVQTSPTSPFDGTSGTGYGTLANRPTTCTAGVAYWATDQGSWNTSTSNPYGVQQNGADGVLYKATAANTWTLYYTPYTYPHPLQSASVTTDGTNRLSISGGVSISGKVTTQ